MKLSLIVPVFNEAQHLERWLAYFFGHTFPNGTEFIFIDDCSTDGSADILKTIENKPNVRVLYQSRNQGKGAAVRLGITESKGDEELNQDADFEYSPKDIPAILRIFEEDEADVVYGSRYKNSQTVHRTMHYFVNRFLTMASNLASGLYVTDMETCYKAFRGDIIRNITLTSDRFGFEPEITAKIASLKLRVAEVPIRYFPRSYLEGKKIRWHDGVAALGHIVRFNFSKREKEGAIEKVPALYRRSKS